VTYAADCRIERMHGLDLLAHQLPHNRRELGDARHAKLVQAAIGTLRLDNRVVLIRT